MTNLKLQITNEMGRVMGEYTIECLDRPGLNSEEYDSRYTIDLVRAASERHEYLSDFPEPPPLSLVSATYYLDDFKRAVRLKNVNELWQEIHTLLLGARLNFATSRVLKCLEDEHSEATDEDLNARFELHLDKMERFHLAIFEMTRIEDLIVRIVYEFFGDQFIDVDETKNGWEKKLTWNRMKEALNKKGMPEKNPHHALEAMGDREYQELMSVVRRYRTPEVLELIQYRDIKTHRVTPSVDHPQLAVEVSSLGASAAGSPATLFASRTNAEYQFLELYRLAKKVYAHLLRMVLELNEIVHA
jgi:hypothetical protein